MRTSPLIVPHEADHDTYLVLDHFGGRIGCVWRETDVDSANRKRLIRDLVDGQYNKPVRIVAFNSSEGWCRDVNSARCRSQCSTSWTPTGANVFCGWLPHCKG